MSEVGSVPLDNEVNKVSAVMLQALVRVQDESRLGRQDVPGARHFRWGQLTGVDEPPGHGDDVFDEVPGRSAANKLSLVVGAETRFDPDHRVEFAGKVVKKRAPGNAGLFSQFVEREAVESSGDDQILGARSDRRGGLPSSRAVLVCHYIKNHQVILHYGPQSATTGGVSVTVRTMSQFSDLSAVFLNCSLERDPKRSHTGKLMSRVGGIMRHEGVAVESIHMLEHQVGFGMVEDSTTVGDDRDDWPAIHAKIMAADILVIGTPIWLGVKSSVASLAIERLYAYSGQTNDKGQYLYYGKTAGCVVTGNEDGVKACSMETLYALSHIGYTIPPQADCGWLGEIGPGPSYGEQVPGSDVPAGYDSEFTNKNATTMAWNLMHTAAMLSAQGGFPVGGNVGATWRESTNAADQDPEGF